MNNTPSNAPLQTVRVNLRFSRHTKRWEFFWGAFRALWSGRVTVEYEINGKTLVTERAARVAREVESLDRTLDSFDKAFAPVEDFFKCQGFPKKTRDNPSKRNK